MKINSIRALRGPNYSHSKPLIFMNIDVQEYEEKPSNLVENFRENLEGILPSLYTHTCSIGEEGGFFQRVEMGTWPGHVIEHIAIELQNLAGHYVTYGKTYTTDQTGIYYAVFRYLNEAVGLRAGEMAFDIVEKLYQGEKSDIQAYVEELKEIDLQTSLGVSTQSIVDAALARDIPYYRLNEYNYVQLGQGKKQRRIEATTTDATSSIGAYIAKDKYRTKKILSNQGIPVPKGKIIYDWDDFLEVSSYFTYPLLIKPVSGNHGRGIRTNIKTEEEAHSAFDLAKEVSESLIVEEYLTGYDYRLLVINGKLEAAALREPAYVLGDGEKMVEELVELENAHESRGQGHENIPTKIPLDEDAKYCLEKQGLGLDSIIEEGRKVYVSSTANLSTGGTATDVTDQVHSSFRRIVERASYIIDLDIMGVDLLAEDISKEAKDQTAGIVEINSGPGFRMHLSPSKGQARNVGKAVVDMLFPEEGNGRIPLCAITGTNGKTTTSRLVNHIVQSAGKIAGMSSTEGIFIDGQQILQGDYSGPGGAQMILKDPSVDCAVLEVARGGILRRGLGFDWADVGVLLNVSSDHLGLDGINDLKQLARVKGVVTESVREGGYTVYNADDPLVVERAHLTQGQIIYFSLDKTNKHLQENLDQGNFNILADDGKIYLQSQTGDTAIAQLEDIPLTFAGQARFNVQNVMAAIGAAYGLGIETSEICEALMTFYPDSKDSSGRMNFFDLDGFRVLVDYGHNSAAIQATSEFINHMMPGDIIRMVEPTGDRGDEDIIDFARAVSKSGDYFIITDTAPRGRAFGETSEMVREVLLEEGISENCVEIINDEPKAVNRALDLAKEGDLVVLQINDIKAVTQMVLDRGGQAMKVSKI